jgi:ribosomal protein S18 acetylase RimI-like enzyme
VHFILVPECDYSFDLAQLLAEPSLSTSRLPVVQRVRHASKRRAPHIPASSGAVTVRAVKRADLDEVIAIDARVTGIEKRSYWQRVYRRYGVGSKGEQRWFLVALAEGRVAGFLIGEVRDWEFGSPPCGWVFAIDIDPQARQAGIGTRLLSSLSTSLRRTGVRKLRTLLARDNTLILSFFRSQGMMAAPMIPLEMDLIPEPAASETPR